MAGSLEAFKIFQESEKRRQARYEQIMKERAEAEEKAKAESASSSSAASTDDSQPTQGVKGDEKGA